jgi:tRNA-specific 2-thiouridylase
MSTNDRENNLAIPAGASAVVAMSGGVDSSVTAALLCEQGVQVTGATMLHKKSGQERDLADAQEVCKLLGIKHLAINIADEYETFLKNEVHARYAQAITPNPCVLCNEQMKFGLFFNTLAKLMPNFSPNTYWASGHYARVVKYNDNYFIKQGAFILKDQSYFLYRLSQAVLARLRFPLGDKANKSEVRALAGHYGLPTQDKADSQDFCLGEVELRPKNEKPVILVDEQGNFLGQGKGFSHYTIGQRRGMGIAANKPLYVTKLNYSTGEVVLGGNEALFNNSFRLSNVVLVPNVTLPLKCTIKVRSASTAKEGVVHIDSEGSYIVTLNEAERAISPGQSAVFYNNNLVLGGGYITN